MDLINPVDPTPNETQFHRDAAAAKTRFRETPTTQETVYARTGRQWQALGCDIEHVCAGLILAGNETAWDILKDDPRGPFRVEEVFTCPVLREFVEVLLPLAEDEGYPTETQIQNTQDTAGLFTLDIRPYYVCLMAGAYREYRAWKPAQRPGEGQFWRFVEEVFFRAQYAIAERVDEMRDRVRAA